MKNEEKAPVTIDSLAQGFVVRKENLPTRCEICHQTDVFDPQTGECRRCSKLPLPLLLDEPEPEEPEIVVVESPVFLIPGIQPNSGPIQLVQNNSEEIERLIEEGLTEEEIADQIAGQGGNKSPFISVPSPVFLVLLLGLLTTIMMVYEERLFAVVLGIPCVLGILVNFLKGQNTE